jgi:hypothetical protein
MDTNEASQVSTGQTQDNSDVGNITPATPSTQEGSFGLWDTANTGASSTMKKGLDDTLGAKRDNNREA